MDHPESGLTTENAKYPSPARLVLLTAGTAFIVELFIMETLPNFGLSPLQETLADALLLTILFLPTLYLLVYRPMVGTIERLRRTEVERERLIAELQEAIAQVKTLSGLLPICSWCKKIRDEQGEWRELESYICKHSDAEFTHSVCPKCFAEIAPEE